MRQVRAPRRGDQQIKINRKGDTLEITAKGPESRIDQLVAYAGLDPREWEQVECTVNNWEGFYVSEAHTITRGKQGDEEVSHTHKDHQTVPLYQIKVRLRRRADKAAVLDLLAELTAELRGEAKRFNHKIRRIREPDDGFYHELCVFDPHLGKLCWGEEVGTNFDSKIAVDWISLAYDKLMGRMSSFPVKRYILPIGNDFFNVDNDLQTTTKGTQQQEDGRWQKTFKVGKRLVIGLIERLAEKAPVDVIIVPGNHDYQRVWYLGEVLDARFNGHPNVSVDNTPGTRKYWHQERVLLGFTHGDKEKKINLPLILATDMRQAWANSAFCEVHTGHLHTKGEWSLQMRKTMQASAMEEYVYESRAVRVRRIPSLTPPDVWHHGQGYLQLKSAEGLVWSGRHGCIAQASFSIEEEPELERQG